MDTLGMAAGPLVVLVAAVAAVCIGGQLGQRLCVDAERKLWAIVAVGLVAARVGFVWQFHAAYAAMPTSILDLRDGGWSPEAGFVAAWLFAIRSALRHPRLKRPIRWAVISGTVLWITGTAALAAQRSQLDGSGLPALTLATPAGAPIDLRAFKGKPVVLNLWATWCPPCNREMPMLAQAQADHPEVQFVFVDQGDAPVQVASWIALRRLAMRNVVVDPQRQAGAALGQRAFPTTYFYDAGGQLVGDRIGELSLATLTDKLRLIATPSR